LEAAVRAAKASDSAFILDAWVESFRESHSAGVIPMPMYRRVYKEAIAWLLARDGMELLVACNPLDEDQVFGFLAHELGVIDRATHRDIPALHYLFVKQPFRRLGIARQLLAASAVNTAQPFYASFKTAVATELARSKRLAVKWNPLFARFPKKPATEKSLGT
jgi:hypothetical protein